MRAIRERVSSYRFDAIYGAFWDAVIPEHGEERMRASVDRHLAWLDRPAD